MRTEDVTLGFIAWAMGGVIGALPAGFIGVRIGRRNTMLLGFALMAACLIALDRVTTVSQAVPLLALASASWTLPTVNAYPLFVEPIAPNRRGVLAALFLLSMALGGAIGDPLNGGIFDLFGSYRSLFCSWLPIRGWHSWRSSSSRGAWARRVRDRMAAATPDDDAHVHTDTGDDHLKTAKIRSARSSSQPRPFAAF